MHKSISPWAILAVTSLAVFAVALDAQVLFVAFPAIERSFSTVSSVQLSWILNAYTIVYGALLVPAGRFADRFGRKRIFLAGVAIFTIGSLACGLAGNPAALITARIFQAVGGAMLTPTSLALILAAFPQQQRTIAVTIWGSVSALAVVIGPPLGSLIIQSVGWPSIFFLNLPVGLVTGLIGNAITHESRDETSSAIPDLLGVLLLIAGSASLAYGIVQSEEWGWSSSLIWGALLIGGAMLIGFTYRSAHVATPALDVTLFQDRTFSLANIALFLFGIAFTAMFLNSIFFLTRIWGYSLIQTGLASMPGPLMVVICAPLAGRAATTYGHRRILIIGGLLYALGAANQLLNISTTPHFWTTWFPSTLLTGLGVALVLPILSSAAVQQLPAQKLAVGSGVSQALRQFGSVLGVSLTFAILGQAPTQLAPFQHIFTLMIAGGLCVSILSLGMPTHTARSQSKPELAYPQVGVE